MKTIFISYADATMAYSLKRIGQLASRLNLFDEIILFSSDNLPDYIKKSPLMKFKRGGGFWSWKPAIMWETLQKYPEGTRVVYADAGCTLQKSELWDYYFSKLDNYNVVCFHYKDEMLSWDQFGQTSTKIQYWSKNAVKEYFVPILNNPNYANESNMVMGGCFFLKGRENSFVKEWLRIVLEHPDLIIDPTHQEHIKQFPNGGFHAHDQAIITALAILYEVSVLNLEETSETCKDGPILATRVRAKSYFDYLKIISKSKFRSLLGDNFYSIVKAILKGGR